LSKQLGYDEQLNEFLKRGTVQDVKPSGSQDLVQCDSKDSISESFKKLSEHDVHSIPVFDSRARRYVGLLDWKDFATYLLKLYESSDARVAEIAHNDEVVPLTNMSERNMFFAITSDSPLLDLIEGFSEGGVHRRPVFGTNDSTKIAFMVSQSDVVRYLYDHLSELGPVIDTPISQIIKEVESSELFCKLDTVITVTTDIKILDVLRHIVDNQINGVGVVNEKGVLVGNISVSDLKYLVDSQLENINLPTGEFLCKVERRQLVACAPNATFGEVIRKLAQEQVYRMYIVEDNKPIAVVTLTDVMNALLTLTAFGLS